jgi:hypothetical protein
MQQFDALGKKTQRSPATIEKAKRHIAKALKETARRARQGSVLQKDIKGTVDVEAYRSARQSRATRDTPLFEVFGNTLANNIARMLDKGTTPDRLDEVCKVLGDVTLDDDKRIVARLNFELGQLCERAATWRKRVTLPEHKVTTLQIAKGGNN